jgi:hypothetical protein
LLFVAGKELGERKEGPLMAHKCNPASEEDENLHINEEAQEERT